MSSARATYLRDIAALTEAVSIPNVGSASKFPVEPGLAILRRGAAITGQVMLESFVRERVEEILVDLQRWPAEYNDFPKKFRHRATVEALPYIEKYARMLRNQNGEFEAEVIAEMKKMTSIKPPTYQFTKFIAGDYTGNLSDSGLQELLNVFQVKNCWNTMHSLSSDIGFGVPSVKEVLRSIVANRHRSAHVGRFSPSASDVLELPQNLRLIGICVDAALTASVRVAVNHWEKWVSDDFDWLTELDIYFLNPHGNKFRLAEKGARRAIRILDSPTSAMSNLPKKNVGKARLVVQLADDGRPSTWDIA